MRHIHGHGDRTPADLLADAARWCRDHDIGFDVYGTGAVIEALERRVADLLGFEAGRFMPSGVMAQTIAMRVWAERARRPHFGMHPTSHLELHEERAYSHVHGLHATLVGPADAPMQARHLAAVREPLAALLVELPIREAGGQLPTWDELEALKAAAAARGIPLHLDGARLWECGPGYGREYAAICKGFRSAYVSFYKGVGALSGAMLLGDADFVAEAAIWQRRLGGTLWSQIPSVATASLYLDDALASMPAIFAHARALAAAIADVPGVRVLPDPPHTCMFHVVAERSVEDAVAGRQAVEDALGIRAFAGPRPGPLPGTFRTEIYVGRAGLEVTPDEAREAWQRVMAAGRG
ncbi:MAG: threonine aldolase [Alphaproteobacteria bacterium]|nr:threonine aldolase [Alphaproteobacteria bacterium]